LFSRKKLIGKKESFSRAGEGGPRGGEKI